MRFEIRPAGKDTPRIDPRPIVAGWKLLQTSSPGAPAIDARAAAKTSVGQVLLLGRHELQRLVLDNPKIAIYPCGREDIEAGRVDHRVLATLQLLAMSGLSPTVSSLQCGHSRMTASGNVSEHWSGNAVDIAAINGTPILGHQGAGSIAETTIQRLLTLQGTMRPHQIISLMTFQGAANTLALADHADHIHVGFSPTDTTASSLNARLFDGVLEPKAWRRLIDRLADDRQPARRTGALGRGDPCRPLRPPHPRVEGDSRPRKRLRRRRVSSLSTRQARPRNSSPDGHSGPRRRESRSRGHPPIAGPIARPGEHPDEARFKAT